MFAGRNPYAGRIAYAGRDADETPSAGPPAAPWAAVRRPADTGASKLLMETGDALLLEDGSFLLLDGSSNPVRVAAPKAAARRAMR